MIDDLDDDFTIDVDLPSVEIVGQLEKLQGSLVIVSDNLKIYNDILLKHYGKPVVNASIIVRKKFIQRLDTDEYIESEQLYSTSGEVTYEEAVSATVDIVSYPELNLIVMPNFGLDKVNYNLIAQLLLNEVKIPIISISPGQIPYSDTVCSLGDTPETLEFPGLVPPFVITGISGSIVSYSKALNIPNNYALILQSEGVPGFEKINQQSIVQVAKFLKAKFSLYGKFDQDCDKSLSYGKAVNNLGLYL